MTPAIVKLIVKAGNRMHDDLIREMPAPVIYCPICGVEADDEGWDDCGCYYDLIFHD